MTAIKLILLIMLIVCSIAVSLTKNLLSAIIIYMAYSLLMPGLLSPLLTSVSPPSASPSLLRCVQSP
jgi:uncharacterized MnhB-related membrane protein